MNDSVNPIGVLVVGIVIFGLYFIPTISAFRRDHHNKAAIFMLNFLLGWTILGWVIAVIWSWTKVEES